jgi:hypothetical protein
MYKTYIDINTQPDIFQTTPAIDAFSKACPSKLDGYAAACTCRSVLHATDLTKSDIMPRTRIPNIDVATLRYRHSPMTSGPVLRQRLCRRLGRIPKAAILAVPRGE